MWFLNQFWLGNEPYFHDVLDRFDLCTDLCSRRCGILADVITCPIASCSFRSSAGLCLKTAHIAGSGFFSVFNLGIMFLLLFAVFLAFAFCCFWCLFFWFLLLFASAVFCAFAALPYLVCFCCFCFCFLVLLFCLLPWLQLLLLLLAFLYYHHGIHHHRHHQLLHPHPKRQQQQEKQKDPQTKAQYKKGHPVLLFGV